MKPRLYNDRTTRKELKKLVDFYQDKNEKDKQEIKELNVIISKTTKKFQQSLNEKQQIKEQFRDIACNSAFCLQVIRNCEDKEDIDTFIRITKVYFEEMKYYFNC